MRLAIAILLIASFVQGLPGTAGAISVRQLPNTESEWGTSSPAWSPDSKALAVVSWSIWGPLRFLISSIDAYEVDSGAQIAVSGLFALPCYGCENYYTDPNWSPDGTSITLAENFSIWIANVADTTAFELNGSHGGWQPAWSPDGARIAFAAGGISILPSTGGVPTNLTNGLDQNPAWSPDGTWIAYDSRQNGAWGLWKIPAAGGSAVRIPHGSGDARHPTWSPDGQLIAFASNLDGHWDIWVIRLATGQLSRLTHDAAHDSEPAWSPDGQKIAFVSDRSGSSTIWIADDLSTVAVESATWSEIKSRYRE